MASISGGFPLSLTAAPHTFLQPSLPLYTDTLTYLKHALDPIAADVSAVQQRRQQAARKKRKRGQQLDQEEVLRLKQIHTEGLDPAQVWQQARRVIDAARVEAQRGLAEAQARYAGVGMNGAHAGEDMVVEDDDSEDFEDLGEEGVDYEVEGPDDDAEDIDGADGEDEVEAADVADDGDFDMDEEDFGGANAIVHDEPAEELVADKFGLNDGFFSIDDFNRKSEFLEQQDTRGDNDGAASDESDVDWDADPLGQVAATPGQNGAANGDDAEEDEEGPTFGDLDAPSEDEDEEVEAGEMDGIGGMANTNNVLYADFFAPPAQKKRKNKKGRPNPHNFPEKTAQTDAAEPEMDMERTMAAVHRDLFEDDEQDEEEEEGQQEQVNSSDPLMRRSTHERRKAALAEEIRKLEAANVAKREWTLAGEARAVDRPLNSLLEEDLDFERAGKPVPVITAEVSESIEDLIKRRILAYDFQDIIRRRPDDLATGKDGRRGRLDFQLDDNKSKKGLAEEYEEEHMRRTDPNFVDVKDEKLKKEEKEIEALWNKVRGDLDSLSSWHFRPKPAAPQMEIRVDAPAISMEDARPTAGGEVAGASQLAPQEVYRAGDSTSGKEEVAGKSGLPARREEMSREERTRRRRREKERIRKAGTNDSAESESKGSKDKQAVLGNLKRGGVKVIGKKGGLMDTEGRDVKAAGGVQGGGRYKL